MEKKICKMSECGKQVSARGFCVRHYAQLQRGFLNEAGEQLKPLARIPLKFQPTECKVDGCSGQVKTLGWCNKHYLRFRNGNMNADGTSTGRERYWHNKGYRTYMRGYRKIMAPENHPYSDKDGYVLEHRLVMEAHIGRYLQPGEVVHHINGKRDDNRIENLQLRVSRKDHGHGHEDLESVEKALAALDRLVNSGMSGAEEVRLKLSTVLNRL